MSWWTSQEYFTTVASHKRNPASWKCQFIGLHSMSVRAEKTNVLMWIPFWGGEILQSQEKSTGSVLLPLPESMWAASLHSTDVHRYGVFCSTTELKETWDWPPGVTWEGLRWAPSLSQTTENRERMWPPRGVHNLGQESTAENVRDNCFWESSQTKYLNQKRNVSFLSLYQVLGSRTVFYLYQMWHC